MRDQFPQPPQFIEARGGNVAPLVQGARNLVQIDPDPVQLPELGHPELARAADLKPPLPQGRKAGIRIVIYSYIMRYKTMLLRLPLDIHDALIRLRTERHVNISAWVRAAIKSALEREGVIIGGTGAPHTPEPAASPLPGWRPHRLDNGDWGSIYLGDTSGLPSELVGLTIAVQARNGQSWTTTVTTVQDRRSGQVIVIDSGRPEAP